MVPPKISDRPEEVFTYDPLTGYIFKGDTKVGSPGGHGYLYINHGRGRKHLAHRLAWYLHYGEWPKGNIDHIDRDKTNNRIDNLREVSQTQNLLNHGKPFSGIYKHRKKWQVKIGRSGYLGSFKCFGEALKFRNSKMKEKIDG